MSGTEPPESRELIGQLLQDRYEIVSVLGGGGMGTVYLARDTHLHDRRVVVKIPRTDLSADARAIDRFLKEVRDHARHEHPHILGILDSGEHAGAPFAVMQFLPGGDLGDRLKKCGLAMPVGEVLQWLHPIARALDFVHAKGCLHRDIKPANIIFDGQGHPYLSDFGIATALDVIDSEAPTVAPQDQLTSLGTFVGSPAFAPPEAIDRIFTPAYDQYALATVVYLSLCGRLPFEGKTSEAILIAKASTEPPSLPPERLREELPAGCSRVLAKALAKDPAERFDSCEAFATAFEAETRAAGKPALEKAALAALLTLAIVGAAALAWWSISGDDLEAATGSLRQRLTALLAAARPESVLLGSTEAELAAAIELCREHFDHCDPAEFAGETAHPYQPTPVEMDRFEVTNAEFAEFVQRTGLESTAERVGASWDGPSRRRGLSWRRPGGGIEAASRGDLPVVHVSFDEASAYCESRGQRLPTADEWEYRARGDERRVFPWGDDWDPERLRWTTDTAFGLEPVGSHPGGATPDGLHDLAGSVWEWTSSQVEGERVLKGASWDDRNPAYFRAAAFSSESPETTSSSIGFRCVSDR